MNGMGVGYKHLDQLRDLAQNEGDKSSRIRPLFDGMGTLDTSIWTGYIIWPKGDMRLHTCRVYKTFQEASDVAQERADSHHRPYEVRITCDTSQRIIKTFEPRKSK